jgi:hypothetical protein
MLALLAPIFLAGVALLVAPWLIHRIRRPERETTPFSSLMFVPHTRKEIIERRRLQHILLMLMRMAMLAFLALAFARPYWRTPAAAPVAAPGAAWHVIALDASYSMGVKGWFEAAKARARAVADSLRPNDRVGVVAFARAPQVIAPLFANEGSAPEVEPVGNPSAARQAIDAAPLTEDATAYAPALQAAQSMLASAESQAGGRPARMAVHLISDFQRAGMPEKANRWKLESRIELDCIDVSRPTANSALEDVSLRESAPGELRVLGKVRNWSNAPETSRTVRLIVADKELARTALTLAPGAARQVSFRIPTQSVASLEGRLELDGDALAVDNRRHFAWQAAGKRRVLLLTNAEPAQPSVRFLASALPAEGDLPWRLEIQPPAKAAEALSDEAKRPSILIVDVVDAVDKVDAVDRWTPEIWASIRKFIESGGGALLAIGASAEPKVVNEGLLARLGVRCNGPVFAERRETRFMLLSWIDFDHPIFHPLRSPQFNDFSNVRFYNSQRLSIPAATQRPDREGGLVAPPHEGARVIARFESDAEGNERPAMIESRAGQGRAILWAFGLDLEWSNLPRSVKFIPLLDETLSYLGGGDEGRRSWLVGEPLRPPKETGNAAAARSVRLPGESKEYEWQAAGAATEIRASHSGFVRWREARGGPAEEVEAVNVPARESNPEHVGVEEFQLKLSLPRVELREAASLDLERGIVTGGFAIHREYWRILIGVLFLVFFVESWHAATVVR